ncbi:MAG: hypothetical protein D3903_15455 [Candidatus Electrothrix sp. GM3_4]|nr:hypothetical protein [Candidatus Electrothrix sp. GM3_4]
MISIGLLLFTFYDGQIHPFEALSFLVLYASYLLVLYKWNSWFPEETIAEVEKIEEIEKPVPEPHPGGEQEGNQNKGKGENKGQRSIMNLCAVDLVGGMRMSGQPDACASGILQETPYLSCLLMQDPLMHSCLFCRKSTQCVAFLQHFIPVIPINQKTRKQMILKN